jgi:hypothetical protein
MEDGVHNLASFPRNLVPQKEDLDAISQIPSLILAGINNPNKIAEHFGQVLRHGSFFLNSCEILGWSDNHKLTKDGRRIATANPVERYNLTRNAIRNSAIFKILEKELGTNWHQTPKKERISCFLRDVLHFKKTTADRRASTIVSWANYLHREDKNRRTITKKQSKRKIFFNGIELKYIHSYRFKNNIFDACFVDNNSVPIILVINCFKFGFEHSLSKIGFIKENNIRFILLISSKDCIKFQLAMIDEYNKIRDRILKIEIPHGNKINSCEIIKNYLDNGPLLLKTAKLV